MAKKIDYERVFQQIRVEPHHFKSPEIYEEARQFLIQKKRTVGGNIQTKHGIMNRHKKVLTLFFHDAMLIDLTKDYLKTMLLVNKNCWERLRLSSLWEFIYQMLDKGILVAEWYDMFHLKDWLCTFPRLGNCISILQRSTALYYRVYKHDGHSSLFNFDTKATEIQDVLFNFMCHKWRLAIKGDCFFTFLFDSINLHIKLVQDFNYNTFKIQLNALQDFPDKKKYFSQLISFYRFLYINNRPDLFSETKEFNPKWLMRHGLCGDFAEGFRIVPYHPLDKAPKFDKWILSFYGCSEQIARDITHTFKVDFGRIINPAYRKYTKDFIWNHTSAWSTKKGMILELICLFNYIDELKQGTRLTIYTRKTQDLMVTVSEAVAYRQYIYSRYPSQGTRGHFLNTASLMFRYFLQNKQQIHQRGVLEQLKVVMVKGSDKQPIPDSQLKLLAGELKNRASESVRYKLYYCIFYLALETEFRGKQIINLKADCIKETAKENQYIVLSRTKTSMGEEKEQAITIYTKKHLDEIKKLTAPFRADCPNETVNQLLFLEPGMTGGYRPINIERFRKYLKQCCQVVNIPSYTLSNLRDTHMTKAEEFMIRQGLSEVYLSVLTDHKSIDTTQRHYAELELTEILEATYGVIIGNIDLQGNIQADSTNYSTEQSVSNQCGYCNHTDCDNLSYLDCLMCFHFVTMPSRLPFFEEQIKRMDIKIHNSEYQHDREDLTAIKRLLTAYTKELILFMEDDPQ